MRLNIKNKIWTKKIKKLISLSFVFFPLGCFDQNLTINQNKISEQTFTVSISEVVDGNIKKTGDVTLTCISDDAVSITRCSTGVQIQDFTFKQYITYAGNTYKIEEIGDQAFELNEDKKQTTKFIGTVSIGENIKRIGYRSFFGCSDLTSIDFSSAGRLVSVEAGAFANCSKLSRTIQFPTTLQDIYGDKTIGAFSGCSSIESIDFTLCKSLKIIGEKSFYGCEKISKNVIIPASVSTIGDYAFTNCSEISTIELEKNSSLTKIGDYAFKGCSNMVTPEFSNLTQLSSIGSYAFDGCSEFAGTLFIPESVTNIGLYAFGNIDKIATIYLNWDPQNLSLINIGKDSLPKISDESKVSVPEARRKYYDFLRNSINYYEYNQIISRTFSVKLSQISNINSNDKILCTVIDNGKSIIISKAELSQTAKDLTFNNSFHYDNNEDYDIVGIGDRVFYNSSFLTGKVTFGKNFREIGVSSFENCININSINLSESRTLEKIGQSAFRGCINLKEDVIDFPSTLLTIGPDSFANSGTFSKIIFNWDSSQFSNLSISGDSCMPNFKSDGTTESKIYVPSGLMAKYLIFFVGKDILKYNLEDFSVDLSETIPLNQIASYDSKNNSAILTECYFDNYRGEVTVKSIDNLSTEIQNLSFNNYVEYNGFKYKLVSFNDECFLNQHLIKGTISFPSTILSIRKSAFQNTGISKIVFSDDSNLYSLGESCFESCWSLSEFDMSKTDKLQTLGDRCFYNCLNFDGDDKLNFYIPSSLIHMGVDAFKNTKRANSISFNWDPAIFSNDFFKIENDFSLPFLILPTDTETPVINVPIGCKQEYINLFEERGWTDEKYLPDWVKDDFVPLPENTNHFIDINMIVILTCSLLAPIVVFSIILFIFKFRKNEKKHK